MKVEQIMTRDVRACRPSDTLSHAAQILWERDCGVLPVVEGEGKSRVVGMLTDRMSACAYTQGRVCAISPWPRYALSCAPADTVEAAAERMRRAQVRRLPVVDESGQLLGVLSLADLAHEVKGRGKAGSRAEALARVGEMLDGITQPRTA